jgi:integrase
VPSARGAPARSFKDVKKVITTSDNIRTTSVVSAVRTAYDHLSARLDQSAPDGPEHCGASLAARPYDLRHACLSTWLNGGVYPTQVAEWAGHGVDVLLRIYAKCVVGQDELAKRRISEALRQD